MVDWADCKWLGFGKVQLSEEQQVVWALDAAASVFGPDRNDVREDDPCVQVQVTRLSPHQIEGASTDSQTNLSIWLRPLREKLNAGSETYDWGRWNSGSVSFP